MKRVFAAALAAALLLTTASTAAAAPTPTFTATALGNQTMTFDATASPCLNGPCGYTWKYFGPATNRLGVQMGRVAKVDYRFPSIGFYSVVLTVSGRCSPKGVSSCPASVTRQVAIAS